MPENDSSMLGRFSQREADETIAAVRWTLYPGVLIYRGSNAGAHAAPQGRWIGHDQITALCRRGWRVFIDNWRNQSIEAWKGFDSENAGIAEWEALTGRERHESGCDCCGAPHEFQWLSHDE